MMKPIHLNINETRLSPIWGRVHVMACGYGMVSEIDKKRCTKKADEVTCKKCLKYIVPQKQGR